ncbi:hypothetical protein GBA52_004806, partial [Prunus armeniaca]
ACPFNALPHKLAPFTSVQVHPHKPLRRFRGSKPKVVTRLLSLSTHLYCTDMPKIGGMCVSDTPPIRYGTITIRIVDFSGMLTLRYGPDTTSIRSQYASDTLPIRQGVSFRATKRRGRKNEEEKNLLAFVAATNLQLQIASVRRRCG